MTTFTDKLTPAQAELLRAFLVDRGFTFHERPYTLYAASKDKLQVSVYEKGPKVLVQGKGTQDFVKFVLEPEIFGEIRTGYEEERFPEMFQPHFGVDESGKGDFFGPLVVAGVYVENTVTRALLDAGVCDSKRITSDARIRDLADTIRKTPRLVHEVVLITPKRYNELHAKIGNVNRLLAWAHVIVIQKLHARRPDCLWSLSDQFAEPGLLRRVANKKGLSIEIQQRPRAESDPAVAAASILAREAFVGWLDEKSSVIGGEPLPRGCSVEVQSLAQRLLDRLGRAGLGEVGKMHFRFVKGGETETF